MVYWQPQQGNEAALFLPGAHGPGTEAKEKGKGSTLRAALGASRKSGYWGWDVSDDSTVKRAFNGIFANPCSNVNSLLE